MKTNWEKYIAKNRPDLDVEEPDYDNLWIGVDHKLDKKSSSFMSWKIAAIILVALMSGYLLNAVLSPTPKSEQKMLADISPEDAEQEQFYLASIEEKWDQIKLEKIKRADYADIFQEMNHLDLLKAESLNDFAELGGNPRLIKTLFEYYEIKIRLLEIMLAEIDKNKNDKIKNQKDEKYY